MTARSEPSVHPQQAVIHIKPVGIPEKLTALLFNSDRCLFGFAEHETIDFKDWFVEEAHDLFDGGVVDFYGQAAEELIGVIFQGVLFYFSDFNCELHMLAFREPLVDDSVSSLRKDRATGWPDRRPPDPLSVRDARANRGFQRPFAFLQCLLLPGIRLSILKLSRAAA